MVSVMCASQYQSSSCSHWWHDRWGWICNGHTPARSNATHSNQDSLACYPEHISIKRPGMPGVSVLKVARSGLAARQNMDAESWAYIGSVWAEKVGETDSSRKQKQWHSVFIIIVVFISLYNIWGWSHIAVNALVFPLYMTPYCTAVPTLLPWCFDFRYVVGGEALRAPPKRALKDEFTDSNNK